MNQGQQRGVTKVNWGQQRAGTKENRGQQRGGMSGFIQRLFWLRYVPASFCHWTRSISLGSGT